MCNLVVSFLLSIKETASTASFSKRIQQDNYYNGDISFAPSFVRWFFDDVF